MHTPPYAPMHTQDAFYYATMYLPIETEYYYIDDRKSYQQVKSWKLSRLNAGRMSPRSRLISPEKPVTGVGNDWFYDDCAPGHVILPSFRL